MKFTANSYVPFRGAVNTPELASYPSPMFVFIESNFTMWFCPKLTLLDNVARNAGFFDCSSPLSENARRIYLSQTQSYN